MNIIGKIDSSSGRKSIYGYLLDRDNPNNSQKAILCIDNDQFTIECNIHKDSLLKRFGNGEHAFKFEIPQKYKNAERHSVKLLDFHNSKLVDSKTFHFKSFELNKIKPKVSIVVPVYNTGHVLEKTIGSIVSQTLQEIEIIIVNDCSTDNSKEIINSYLQTDSRIRYIEHPENKSSSQARKNGVEIATAEFIMFVDGDDELYPDAVETAYKSIVEHDVDIFNFGTNVINCGNMIQSRIDMNQKMLAPYIGKLEGDLLKSCFIDKKFSFNLWNKIYKTKICKEAFKLVEDGNFPKAQDLYAFFFISKIAKSYFGCDNRLYKYNFGLGVTGGDTINYERFAKLVSESLVVNAIKRYNESNPTNEEKEIIDTITYNLVHECYSKFDNQLISEDKTKGFDLLVNSFGAYTVISYLSKKFWYQRPMIGEKLKDFSFFSKSDKKDIKTIAVYYNTLSNGGAQRVTVQIANLLCNNYKVIILSDDSSKGDQNEYSINTKIIHEYLPDFNKSRAEQYSRRAERWKSIIEKHKIDMLITGFWLAPVTFWDIVALKLYGVKVLMHSHNTCALPYKIEDQTSLDLIYRYFMCDGVVALSRCDEFFISSFNKNCMTIANPPCDGFEKSSQIGRKKNGFRILWLGRISDEKRPLDVIKMMKYLVHDFPNCHLSIVGKGNENIEKRMKEQIVQDNLSDNITMEGFTLDVSKYYKQADVFVCTSEYEGWPLTLGEAMSHHLPIVSYDMPYLEYFADGRGIVSVPQLNVEKLANEVRKLLQDHEQLNKMGEEAYKNIYDKNQENILEKWNQIIHNISVNEVKGIEDFTKEEIDKIKSIVLFHITKFQNKVKTNLVIEKNNLKKQIQK